MDVLAAAPLQADVLVLQPPRSQRAAAWVSTPHGGLILLIAATLLARLLFAGALGLGMDESYMVAAGRTLQLGYFDHPPMAWWMAWAAGHLGLGDSPLIVRLPFVLLFALTTLLMYRLTSLLFGPRAALWAAALFNVAPVFGLTTGSWVLPDGPLMAALLGAAICLVEAFRTTRPVPAWAWWLGAGGCAGLALFSKYTAILSLLGAVIYLLTDPAARRWLRRPQPYAAALLALAVFAPVVWWNGAHGWASLLFQAGRAGGAKWHPFGPLSALGGEAIFLLPWLWLPLVVCAWGALRRGPRAPAGWLLVCLALPAILLFLAVALRSHVLFHWAAPGYLMLFPLLGDAIARRRRTRSVRLWLAGSAALVVFGAALVGSEVRFNWLPDLGEPFATGADPGMDAVDWSALKPQLAARGLLGRPGLVLAATRWHDAGKIDYALGGHQKIICLGLDPREYGLLAPQSASIGADVLIIAPSTTLSEIQHGYGAQFDSIVQLAPVMILHNGRPALLVPVFEGYRLRAAVKG